MGVLIDQFNDKEPALGDRGRFFWALNFPWLKDLQKKSAELYMQNGNVLTSCEIFKKIDMMEECVECLAMAGLNKESKEMGLELIKMGRKTPKLLAILGKFWWVIIFFLGVCYFLGGSQNFFGG